MYSTSATEVQDSKDLLLRLWEDNLHVRGDLDDKLRWFYCDSPHGPGRAFLLHANGAPVGCAGLGVRTLFQHGRPLRAALFADLAVDRGHRSGLPALTLLRSVAAEVARDFELGYGFPNRKAIAVYRRAGFIELGQMYRYVRVLRSRRYLRAALGDWIADTALAIAARTRRMFARRFALEWPEAFDARFDRLWQAVHASYPLVCERTAAFLRWRFAQEPHRIAGLVCRSSGELVAYAVYRSAGDGFVELLDLFGAGEHEVGAMLAHTVPAAAALGFTAVGFRFLGDPRVIRLLHAHGFARRGEPRSIVVAGGRGPARAPMHDLGAWYLTDLDEDS
jgi:hypothetical protein